MTRASHVAGLVAPDAFEGAVLDRAQHLFLGLGRGIGNLVEQQGPSIGKLEASQPPPDGAGKSAGLVAEQFGFEERFGKRRAIHPNERAFPAPRQEMKPGPDELLARATLANEQDRAIQGRGARHPLHEVEEEGRFADQRGQVPGFGHSRYLYD